MESSLMVGHLTRVSVCKMADDVGGGQFEFHPVFPSLDLHNSFGKAPVSDSDLEGSSHQICIVELYTCSFVPVIPEYFQSGRL